MTDPDIERFHDRPKLRIDSDLGGAASNRLCLENGPSGGAATGAVISSDALRGNSNTRSLVSSVSVGIRSKWCPVG
jgi:hypothetical protein